MAMRRNRDNEILDPVTAGIISNFELGRRIEVLRHARGMRQVDVAVAAGLSRNAIGAVEAGSPCRVHTVLLIAKALGVKPGDLLDAAMPQIPRMESRIKAPISRDPAEKAG